MGDSGKAPRKMDQYFKDNENDSYVLNTNTDGSTLTREKRWDFVRRVSRRIVEREAANERRNNLSISANLSSQPGVQLLPRRDVLLYGTIPSIEERIYGRCTNCNCVYNPRDTLKHRNCVRTEPPAPPVVKKKVQSKNVNSKKPSSNGSTSSYPTNSNTPPVPGPSSSLQDPLKLFEFKRPFTPPPTKAEPTLPQLKVSVTKIGISKSSRSSTVTSTATHTATATTSSEKVDSKVSSKVSSATHHSSKSSSGHHSSRGHNPKSPSSSSSSASSSSSSSSSHHGSRNTSSHHSPKSPSSSSHHTSKSSSVHYNPRSPSKSSSSSHHGSSHGSHHSSKSSSSSTKSTPMDTLPPSTSTSHHHHTSHSSRHKKSSSGSSKRSASSSSSTTSSTSASSSSSKSLPKNYDPDTHCGVIEGNKGPCMRSITCSNHRLHLRKQVPGRSKDIHQLIAERKAAKENDLKQGSYASPNGEAKDTKNLNTTYVPAVAPVANTSIETKPSTSSSFVPIMPRAAAHQTRQATTTSVLGAKKLCTGLGGNESASTLSNGHPTRAKNLSEENTQESAAGTVPLVLLPVNVSNVSVLNAVQLLKIGNNIITLESPQSAANSPLRKQVILPISGTHTNGIRMYKSHPKPIILPNFGARKLGGAIILANPLLDDQRNNLLTTIDLKLETVNIERGLSGLNHSNSPHRPNILKGKGSVKVNCKRPASDKLITGDSKRLLPDVNGFILETDVTETADALQYSGDTELSQHESIIRLIDQHGF